MVDPINSALETAHQKLSQLLIERSKIDKEMVAWSRVIDSLLAVSEEDGSDPSDVQVSSLDVASGRKTIKFTDGVRMVLRQNASREVPISVPEIREQLINLGFQFEKYAQPLVPIHNTLKRLVEQGEVSPIKSEQGQTLGYKWISPIERALSDNVVSYAEVTGESIVNSWRTSHDADHPIHKLTNRQRHAVPRRMRDFRLTAEKQQIEEIDPDKVPDDIRSYVEGTKQPDKK
jgi:hypothetical protein